MDEIDEHAFIKADSVPVKHCVTWDVLVNGDDITKIEYQCNKCHYEWASNIRAIKATPSLCPRCGEHDIGIRFINVKVKKVISSLEASGYKVSITEFSREQISRFIDDMMRLMDQRLSNFMNRNS